MPGSSDIIKFAALGVGGFFLYEYVIKPMMTVTPVTSGGGSGAPTNTGGTATGSGANTTSGQTNTPTTTTAPSKTDQVAGAMRAAGMDPGENWSADQWNYFYHQLFPAINIPSPESVGLAHDAIPMGKWWSAYANSGLAGFDGGTMGRGLGYVATYINPYNNPNRTPLGSNIWGNGSERFDVQFPNQARANRWGFYA